MILSLIETGDSETIPEGLIRLRLTIVALLISSGLPFLSTRKNKFKIIIFPDLNLLWVGTLGFTSVYY